MKNRRLAISMGNPFTAKNTVIKPVQRAIYIGIEWQMKTWLNATVGKKQQANIFNWIADCHFTVSNNLLKKISGYWYRSIIRLNAQNIIINK